MGKMRANEGSNNSSSSSSSSSTSSKAHPTATVHNGASFETLSTTLPYTDNGVADINCNGMPDIESQ
ncbi:hypothetical protein PV325_001318 [Microctonus aethiopoides]|nr:hypothetical protein PV325_001318 [Microctonus aethiopoides]